MKKAKPTKSAKKLKTGALPNTKAGLLKVLENVKKHLPKESAKKRVWVIMTHRGRPARPVLFRKPKPHEMYHLLDDLQEKLILCPATLTYQLPKKLK
jgi:hypothetical protein